LGLGTELGILLAGPPGGVVGGGVGVVLLGGLGALPAGDPLVFALLGGVAVLLGRLERLVGVGTAPTPTT